MVIAGATEIISMEAEGKWSHVRREEELKEKQEKEELEKEEKRKIG